MIGTPSHRGAPDALYAYCLGETKALGVQNAINFMPVILPGEAILPHARNQLLASAIEAKHVEDLLWIDDDMGWQPAQALRILGHKVDVVGGTARRKTDEESYVVNCDPDALYPGPNGLIELKQRTGPGGLGLGFCRMTRKAFTKLWEMGEPYTDNGRKLRWSFDIRPVNGELVAEDIRATRALATAGIPIYLDPEITCAHAGRHVWNGDFKRWMGNFQQARKLEFENVVRH